MSPKRTKLLIANDSELFLDSIPKLLSKIPNLDVVTATTIGEIDRELKGTNPPDLLLCGLSLTPGDYKVEKGGTPAARATITAEYLEKNIDKHKTRVATTFRWPHIKSDFETIGTGAEDIARWVCGQMGIETPVLVDWKDKNKKTGSEVGAGELVRK